MNSLETEAAKHIFNIIGQPGLDATCGLDITPFVGTLFCILPSHPHREIHVFQNISVFSIERYAILFLY